MCCMYVVGVYSYFLLMIFALEYIVRMSARGGRSGGLFGMLQIAVVVDCLRTRIDMTR